MGLVAIVLNLQVGEYTGERGAKHRERKEELYTEGLYEEEGMEPCKELVEILRVGRIGS